MYTNKKLEIIRNNAAYTDDDGVKHQWNEPKEDISGLYPVIETARPSDTDSEIVLNDTIVKNNDGTYTQTWITGLRTPEELQIIIDSKIGSMRMERDALLMSVDHEINRLVDNGLDEATWRIYRQALRDIPQTHPDGLNIIWPTEPEKEE